VNFEPIASIFRGMASANRPDPGQSAIRARLMHRKRLMMDGYREPDKGALDVLHRRGLPPLSSDSPVWIDAYRKKCSHRAVRTNRNTLAALAVFLTATAATFAANPLVGTWKLNEGKSKFAPGATKNTTVTYTPAKGDMIKCTVDGVDKDGKPIHWTWVGKFDGKPYQIKGSPSFDTLTYKPVNDRTNKTTATKAGKVVMTGTITVAKDGKSRVVTLTGTDANGQKFTDVTYYDKQQ
jgi:hypothetical protein